MFQESLERLRFYGPFAFAIMSAHILFHKIMAGIHSLIPLVKPHSVSNVIQKHQIPKHHPPSLNSKEFCDYVSGNDTDIIISIAATEIFKKAILDSPKRGCINYHMADLPKYRGRQPLFWALFHSEQEVGISVHEMIEKLDGGPIIAKTFFSVPSTRSLHDLYLKTIKKGPEVLIDAVEKIDSGCEDRILNNDSDATVFRFPTPNEARRFRKQGNTFF